MATTRLQERRRLVVTGTVQGVGFRPFVFRQAVLLELEGFVFNNSLGVVIEAQGQPDAIDELYRRILDEPPPLARVRAVNVKEIPLQAHDGGFRITDSRDDAAPNVPVSVDTSTCDDCLCEVDDPADRRYRYPFTNCTNCGPRYTITRAVPYDRPMTTMAGFTMCAACQREYDDPSDRRFHAQPNACPACGPRLSFCDRSGKTLAEGDDGLERAVQALEAGRILAIKGVGGFHLAADATNAEAVTVLRKRKARDDKPFAVMVHDLAAARQLIDIDEAAAAELSSTRRPIVVAPAKDEAGVAAGVAPGLRELGVMVAYSPLHHLLTADLARPLVMTSGNQSDDPIAYENDDAFGRLAELVDAFLVHDRPIHIRCDDSVIRVTPRRVVMTRRARGYAPEATNLLSAANRPVLAVGAELKNTVSVAKADSIFTSHHIGDLEHLATYQSFRQAIGHLGGLFGVTPEVVAHDLHPEYLSTKLALELDLEPWGIQHHHAHIAACLVENNHAGPVLGLAFDGLGYGPDGTIWGGEFLVADLAGSRRVGHLRQVPMPGGSAAIREPWRMALMWAAALGPDEAERTGARLDPRYREVLGIAQSAVLTSSVGRLFDAVSALLDVRTRVSFEGQAAMELETLAARCPGPSPTYECVSELAGDLTVLDPAPLLDGLLADRAAGVDPVLIAAGFHRGLAAGVSEMAVTLARENDVETVALSGGVFQNATFGDVVEGFLVTQGLQVLTHALIPPNDGGISIGQAAIAAFAATPPSY